MTKKKKLSIYDLCFIGIFAAAIAVLGKISIPLPLGVPFTLQTVIIPLAGIVLGWKRGVACLLIYLLLGAVGLPVFSGTLLGPTGGFILSFPLMALVSGLGADLGFRQSRKLSLWVWVGAGLVTGAAVNFFCGMLMYSIVASGSFEQAYLACVAPFLPFAVIKSVIAAVLGIGIRKIVENRSLLA